MNGGKAEGYTDAIAIENAVSSGWIKVAKTKPGVEKLAEEAKIGRGEAEAILLAKQMNTVKLLMDDARARRGAQSLGLKPQHLRPKTSINKKSNNKNGIHTTSLKSP